MQALLQARSISKFPKYPVKKTLVSLIMFTFKPTLFFVSTLVMLAAAAPVESETRELTVRAPYDVHNGWVSGRVLTIPSPSTYALH